MMGSAGVVRALAAAAVLVAGPRCSGSDTETTAVPPSPTPGAVACRAYPATRVVPVATASQLAAALRKARPGDRIELADGTYAGSFRATTSGTSARPIVVCGSRDAVLDAGTISRADGFTLRGSYWTLSGFTVTDALRGVYGARASNNLVTGLAIHGVGQAGIHFQAFSTSNRIENNTIRNTGLRVAEYGEGVYLGTPYTQWRSATRGEPDRSDSNRVLNNTIGPDVRAEGVDVKEGTTGGVIQGNTFDGHGMVRSKPWVDAWVEVKGNGYLVAGNRGVYSPGDGFQTYSVYSGWGNGNVFTGNIADVKGPGYGIRSTGVKGTVVKCDNVVTNAGAGYANVRCSR